MKAVIVIDTQNSFPESMVLVKALEDVLYHITKNTKRITEVTEAELVYGHQKDGVDVEIFNEPRHLTCKEMQGKIKELYGIQYPLFIFKGTDKLAVQAIDGYLQLTVKAGCSPAFMDRVNEHMQGFEDWEEANPDKVKLPD